MARISQYTADTVDAQDKLLGTDGGGATKNFSLIEIAKYFKNTNSAGNVGQMSFIFDNQANNIKGSLHVATSDNPKAFSSLSTIKLSRYTINDSVNIITNYLTSELINKEIIIADSLIPNNYGVYKVTAITVDSDDSNFYHLAITYERGNGGMVPLQYYSIILFSGAQDLHYEHVQSSAAAVWTVNHNLGKFASAIIKLADGQQVEALVNHTNKNTLTITFSGDNSGTAYVN